MSRDPIGLHITTRRIGVGWVVFLVMLFGVTRALAIGPGDRFDGSIDGFTEPYRSIAVAAPEAGIVTELHVKEGDQVAVGQLLATLDQELYLAQLAIAEQMFSAKGALESVTAELDLRRQRLEKLEKLSTQGFSRVEEVERARADVRISEANLMSVLDDKQSKQLELERIKVQIERRNVRARLNGIVTKVHKDVGEYVAPNDPVIVTVVQLDPLALSLSVPRAQAMLMRVDQKVMVRFEATQMLAEAQIEHISPMTDAETNTVAIRFKINNPEGRLRSGDKCSLELNTVPARNTKFGR